MGNLFTVLLIQPMTNGVVLFYHLLGNNLGLAIVAFSVLLKLLLNPLNAKSLHNAKKLQELRPAIAKLKERHKGDKQKFMKAQADLYKEKGFNPMAGCLPQIAQLIVLYAFLAIFNTVFANPDALVENFNKLLYPPLQFDASETINTRFLYLDVVKPDTFRLSGIDFALPGPLLILSALAQFVSAKIMMPGLKKEEKIAKKTPDDTDDAMIASQQMTIIMLPILTIIFGMQFASGLALYWFIFSILSAYQQYKIAGWGGMAPLLRRAGLLKNA